MRIAVVQLAIRPAKRTATFQAALRAVDAAAEVDPAPDLILLPAFSDVPAVVSGREPRCERVPGPTTAGFSHRARNWGLFIAYGLAERGPVKPYMTSVLIDRDGDLRLKQRRVACPPNDSETFAAGDRLAFGDILLGRVALFSGDDLLDDRAWDAAVRSGAQVVLGCACWCANTSGDRQGDAIRARIGELASRSRRWCAVADATSPAASGWRPSSGLSAIFNDRGETVAAAEPFQAATLRANVRLAHENAGQAERLKGEFSDA